MIRGTTPTFTIYLDDEDVDLSEAVYIYVTFRQGHTLLTKDEFDELDGNLIILTLSQRESLRFKSGKDIEIQVNWLYDDGTRLCSNIEKIHVGENLIGRRLPYGQ